VRIVVASVLAAAANAVLVAHHLPKLGAHLVAARPAEEIAWRQKASERKEAGVGGGVGNAIAAGNSVAVQQERQYIRLYVYNCKLSLTAISLRRVEIDCRSHAAAPTQVSTVVTPPAPAARNLGVGLRRPCSTDVQRSRVNINGLICSVASEPSQRWR
jgi:hypothetical protein